jgi:hypothetical protein
MKNSECRTVTKKCEKKKNLNEYYKNCKESCIFVASLLKLIKFQEIRCI